MKTNFWFDLLTFFHLNWMKIAEQTLVHTGITFLSLILSLIVAVPVGIFLSKKPKWAPWIIGFASILQTIPSIALLGLMIPLLGIGLKPAIFVLFIYALLPILRNVYTGISEINPSIIESARAMGMTSFQILMKVELPLAMPVMMAGIRTATVINVGVATLAAYIGAGGLGEFIFGGISLNNPVMMVGGALPAALLAIFLDFILSKIQTVRLNHFRLFIPLILLIFLLGSLYFIPKSLQTKLIAGLTPEFYGRKDGYLGLQSVYQLHVSHVIISDAIMYTALRDGALDIVSGYSTDGRIQAYDLTLLEDNRHVFPPYQAAPLVRKETLDRLPEVEGVLNLLAGKISDSSMIALNYEVDYLKKNPKEVAERFLRKIGLYREPLTNSGEKFIIGTKIFTEQYILSALYTDLLKGYTHLNVITKTGLGGTEVCFGALKNKEIDMYPEYSGTGLLVILKTDDQKVDSLKKDARKSFGYIDQEFNKNFGIRWLKPIGFNNAYCLVMRRQSAQSYHIRDISDLVQYLSR